MFLRPTGVNTKTLAFFYVAYRLKVVHVGSYRLLYSPYVCQPKKDLPAGEGRNQVTRVWNLGQLPYPAA